ncbi:hypothetical protein ACHAWF_012044 [Thalassiosira exigua]
MTPSISSWKRKAAVHALESKAEGLLQPLIEEDEESKSSSRSSEEESQYSGSGSTITIAVKPTATQMLKTTGVSLGLAVGAAASLGAIAISPVIAVFVMAGICIVNIPYSAYKEYEMIKLPALRSVMNRLREDAKRLEEEIDVLAEEIDFLQPEAARAKEVEEELQQIVVSQHGNVDRFVALVRENFDTIERLKVCCIVVHKYDCSPLMISSLCAVVAGKYQAKDCAGLLQFLFNRIHLGPSRFLSFRLLVQDIMRIVMLSDTDNNGMFSKVETKMLVLKISLALQEYGVEFEEDKFYHVMQHDPSVVGTLDTLKGLVPSMTSFEDDDSNDSNEEGQDLDMFHIGHESIIGKSAGGQLMPTVPSSGGQPMPTVPSRRLSLSVKKK